MTPGWETNILQPCSVAKKRKKKIKVDDSSIVQMTNTRLWFCGYAAYRCCLLNKIIFEILYEDFLSAR